MPPVVAEEQAGVTPDFAIVQSVHTVTGADAGFAARTLVEMHLEGVLLAGLRLRQRNQITVILRLRRDGAIRVPPGKTFDRRESLLFCQQLVNQCSRVV
jgi:hypothetical protein